MHRALWKAATLAGDKSPRAYERDLARCDRLSRVDCNRPCVFNERLGRCAMPPRHSLSELPDDVIDEILNPLPEGFAAAQGFRLRLRLGVGVDRGLHAAAGRRKEVIVAVSDADRPAIVERLVRDICDDAFDRGEAANARALLFPSVEGQVRFGYVTSQTAPSLLEATWLLCNVTLWGPAEEKYRSARDLTLYLTLSWFNATDAAKDEWIRATEASGDDNALVVLALMPQQLGLPYADALWEFRSILTRLFLQRCRDVEQLATPPVGVGPWNARAEADDFTAAFVRRAGCLSNDTTMEVLMAYCIPDVMMQIIQIYGPVYALDPAVPPVMPGAVFNPYLPDPSALVRIVEFVHAREQAIARIRESVVLTMFALRLCELTPEQIACGLCRKLGSPVGGSMCDGPENFDAVRPGGIVDSAWRDDKYGRLRAVFSAMFEEAFHARLNNRATCLA